MKYLVELSDLAKSEIDENYAWWLANRSPAQADRWLKQISRRISSIADDPFRFALAPESVIFPFEMRQMLFSIGRRPTHRIVFQVRGNTIEVYSVKHVSRKGPT